MAIQVQSEGGNYSLAVDDEMTISRAAELMPQLLAPLADAKEIEISLAGVHEIDSAGLQLLLLTKKEAVNKGIPLRYVAHSKPVVDLLDLCNLIGHFGDPVVISSSSRSAEDSKDEY